jgi:hypothetical protein
MDWYLRLEMADRWILTTVVFALVGAAWTRAAMWLGWVGHK